MLFTTLVRLAVRPVSTPRPMMVENLEGRTLMSASVHSGVDLPAVGGVGIDVPLQTNNGNKNLTKALTKAVEKSLRANANNSVLPIQITGVELRQGQLVALGRLGNRTFDLPLTLTTEPNPNDANCPILNLEIGAIELDLLGLVVETSDICLRITAERGPGNLLGNLLCGVAGSLDRGLPLGTVLGSLPTGQLGNVTNALTALLNGALGQVTAPSALDGVGGTRAGATDILNLSLGPIDLNLLGLDVELDNCNNGPVTVDITAESGRGNLLGNLLSGLAGALDGNGNGGGANGLIRQIAREIRRLI